MDYGAETGGVNYILPEFEMVSMTELLDERRLTYFPDVVMQIWEPPYDSTDDTFPCSIDRTEGPLSNDDHMYLLNHFLDTDVLGTGILISDPDDAPTTNGVDS